MVEQTYKKRDIQRVGTLGRGCKSRNLIGKRFISRMHKEFLKVNKKKDRQFSLKTDKVLNW